jgi:hypothetical protein
MPSADFCRPISADRSALSPLSRDNRQISQGKTQNVPRIDAGFIKPTPLRMEDFAVTCPLVPGVPHLISGSCSSPRACGLGFLQTPPRGGCPCPSPSLRLRDHLARGLSPRSFCAMPGTHGWRISRAQLVARRLHALVRPGRSGAGAFSSLTLSEADMNGQRSDRTPRAALTYGRLRPRPR